ncbi:MAG: Bacterial regulatory protein luxR family [Candidatus Eremiobacteraeota bacterium]|nr:Bacterial regulatory protein luxR family [Candidatus Eremiobacteraeota bacterium]
MLDAKSVGRSDLVDVTHALVRGDFEQCLELIGRTQSGNGLGEALLRARALLRLSKPQQVLDELCGFAVEDDSSETSLTMRLLRGGALLRLGEIDRALDIMRTVERDAERNDLAIRSEAALNIALAHYARRDLAAAQEALDRVDSSADVAHARAFEYRGWVASGNAEFERATAMFIAALRRLESCTGYDGFLEANCLQALGFLAVERFDRGTWRFVTDRREGLRWSAQGLAYPQFLVAMSGAAFAFDVEGEPIKAAAEARLAESVAPSPAYRAQALCMRASIARHAGESVGQQDHLHAAIEIFSKLDPQALNDDERLLPLVVAEELANAGRSAEARRVLDVYESIAVTSPLLAITDDIRRHGYERLVMAQVLDAERNGSEALRTYREAFELFRRIGYVRRSVTAALRIVKMMPEDQYVWGHVDIVTANLAESSWIRSGVPALRRRAAGHRLTAVQREYLRLLCAGKSNPEIARIRNRSVHTVRNQIVPLFEMFGVQSRSELVAECIRSGALEEHFQGFTAS